MFVCTPEQFARIKSTDNDAGSVGSVAWMRKASARTTRMRSAMGGSEMFAARPSEIMSDMSLRSALENCSEVVTRTAEVLVTLTVALQTAAIVLLASLRSSARRSENGCSEWRSKMRELEVRFAITACAEKLLRTIFDHVSAITLVDGTCAAKTATAARRRGRAPLSALICSADAPAKNIETYTVASEYEDCVILIVLDKEID